MVHLYLLETLPPYALRRAPGDSFNAQRASAELRQRGREANCTGGRAQADAMQPAMRAMRCAMQVQSAQVHAGCLPG